MNCLATPLASGVWMKLGLDFAARLASGVLSGRAHFLSAVLFPHLNQIAVYCHAWWRAPSLMCIKLRASAGIAGR